MDAEKKRELREQREAAASVDDTAARRKRTAYLAGGIAVIALVVTVGLILVSQAGDDTPNVDSGGLFGGIEQQGIALGDPGAPVTVVEFADLQCPFCAKFATNDLPDLVEKYVRTGQVRMELRLLAFIGPDSDRGARFAGAAAEQNRIWPFAENVYNNQGPENSGYMTDDFLSEQAADIPGLDAEQALSDSQQSAAGTYVEESRSKAGDAGVGGTPAFLIGPTGGDLELVATPDAVSSKIDEALAQTGQ
ncbi:MAG: thioredoxin domain-containing protein [Solirubrobacterales bacterium]